jgi:acetolactate synthase-1/2/3 large subunit
MSEKDIVVNSDLTEEAIQTCLELISKSKRPLILVGGGLSYENFESKLPALEELGLPIATTWNAADYVDFDSRIFAGRPNTYGMRWANAIIQQCDLLIAIGARLGLQQTGFNLDSFAPLARVIRIDIDPGELQRVIPRTDHKIRCDANVFFSHFIDSLSFKLKDNFTSWLEFIHEVKELLPVSEDANSLYADYVNPYRFLEELGDSITCDDIVIPCSSGGAYTSVMQAFKQKRGNLITNNKGLASMGYGLAGAIGSSVANPNRRVFLIEGDGGFVQNLQELGTVANRALNLKIFLFDNSGYASIRLSQKSYFGGMYLGCDKETGVELPVWTKLFSSWGIPCFEIKSSLFDQPNFLSTLNEPGPAAFILKIHQDQPFLPKITSKVKADGTIESNPLHLMAPALSFELASRVFRFLPKELQS